MDSSRNIVSRVVDTALQFPLCTTTSPEIQAWVKVKTLTMHDVKNQSVQTDVAKYIQFVILSVILVVVFVLTSEYVSKEEAWVK